MQSLTKKNTPDDVMRVIFSMESLLHTLGVAFLKMWKFK